MVIPSLVLVASSVVIVLGAVAELLDAVRVRKAAVAGGPEAIRSRLLAEMDPSRLFAWVGLAALAVLAPALVVDLRQPLADVGLVVVALGFSAERGAYLSRRFAPVESRPAWTATVAVLTVVAGAAVAMSM